MNFAPGILIISGAVAATGDVLLEPLRRQVENITGDVPSSPPLTHRAVVTGALHNALQHTQARYLHALAQAPTPANTGGREPAAGAARLRGGALVSTDIVGTTASCVFDSQLTLVTNREGGGSIAKTVGWYDNETAFSFRLLELSVRLESVL